jgi:predicted pyridoxine 5'-phosphate oxidase superfamily flavin-nucleotide-binding protein
LRACVAGVLVVAAWLAMPRVASAALTPEIENALRTSPYVYIATQRKSGGFGQPAEIWFMYRDGAVWVASPATTWRAKRIRAGRPTATIAVGKREGPSFEATGQLVKDPKAYEALFTTLAEKYPDGWKQYEERFRTGLADGSRVLIKYDPK